MFKFSTEASLKQTLLRLVFTRRHSAPGLQQVARCAGFSTLLSVEEFAPSQASLAALLATSATLTSPTTTSLRNEPWNRA